MTDRRLRHKTDDQRRVINDMLKTAVGFIGISSAIITGIVLGNQRDALTAGTANVAAEASAIRDMTDVLALLPNSSTAAAVTELRGYVASESTVQWKALARGRQAPHIDASYRALESAILAIPVDGNPGWR